MEKRFPKPPVGVRYIGGHTRRHGHARGGCRAGHREAGFTLIELMMVLLLAAVLLGLGGPAFQDSIQRNRLQSTVSEFAGALAFARSEAVIRGHPVAICPITTAAGECSGSSWETGFLVFADDGEGGGTPADGVRNGAEERLRIGDATPAGVTVRTVDFQGNDRIVFADDGRVMMLQNGTVVVCDARGASDARALVVTVAGQTRFAVDSDDNGIVEDHNLAVTDVTCP